MPCPAVPPSYARQRVVGISQHRNAVAAPGDSSSTTTIYNIQTVSRARLPEYTLLTAPPHSPGQRPSMADHSKSKRAQALVEPSPRKKLRAAIATTAPPAEITDTNWRSPTVDGGGGGRTGSFTALVDGVVPPHTLLLGTQPSEVSLAHGWYFGKDENAFWHIVGFALGFRRGFHVGANQRDRGDVVPSIAKFLPPLQESTVVQKYDDAVRQLLGAGYALWDILESSERKSGNKKTSMDAHIKKGKAAPIEELVNAHPSIRRLVFVTGSGSAAIFQQHFDAWLASGRFVCGNERAFKVFGDGSKRGKCTTRLPMKGNTGAANGVAMIELVIPPSVSPAAARFEGERNFGEKLDGWMRDVFAERRI